MLRERIWSTLTELTSEGTTVLITTHYMEEAARAEKIAFIRHGRVLSEGAPLKLKSSFGLQTLDDVFYQLCLEDSKIDTVDSISEEDEEEGVVDDDVPLSNTKNFKEINHWECFKALVYKNLVHLKRHSSFITFNLLLPIFSLGMFLACIGTPIRDISLAVTNDDAVCSTHNVNVKCVDQSVTGLIDAVSGNFNLGRNLSCLVLKEIDASVFDKVTNYKTVNESVESVVKGSNVAMVHIEEGFSAALSARILALSSIGSSSSFDQISEEVLRASEVKVRVDGTNAEVTRAVQKSLAVSVHSFLLNYAERCNMTAATAGLEHLGIKVHPVPTDVPVITNLSHAMLPGMMILLMLLLDMSLTADFLASEKESGVLARDNVCGVNLALFLTSHMVVMLIVTLGQIIFSLILLGVIFPGLPSSIYFLLVALFICEAICGMCLGFLITAIFRTRDQVINAGVGLVFPMFILSGILWPRVAMPVVLQWISIFLPVTLSIDMARDAVMLRTCHVLNVGWAFFLPLAWAVIFFVGALLVVKKFG